MRILLIVIVLLGILSSAYAEKYSIGVYYFPGWTEYKDAWWNPPWEKIKPYPELEPVLGWYPEGTKSVAEKHLSWMSDYGIDFVSYDWYWDGKATFLNHAVDAYKRVTGTQKPKYCLLWANHSAIPATMEQFTAMVDYWLANYFKDPQYLQIDGKPVVIVFSPHRLRDNARGFGSETGELFKLARQKAIKAGLPGIHFIGHTPANSYWVNGYMPDQGYDALTAYNYHAAGFTGEFKGNERASVNYQELLEGYKSQWNWILQNSNLPYIVPMTSGWDKRPWGSNTPHDNSRSTPESFRQMLLAGREVMDKNPEKTGRMGIIYAWNEFGEGGYIEPTKKWGFQYLQAVKDVFGP
jgi:hypothetical protein